MVRIVFTLSSGRKSSRSSGTARHTEAVLFVSLA